jgi:uncharacterized protein (DUF58 family)
MPRKGDRGSHPAGDSALEASLQALARKLEFQVLALADSLRPGENPSNATGRGIEFSGIREYQHGDEARGIDWRVTARRSRLFVKEFSQERELPTLIILHLGPSLLGARGPAKANRCREVAALLAALALRTGDRVGFLHSGLGQGRTIPLGNTRGQLALILREMLSHPTPEPPLLLEESLKRARFMLGERARVFLVGDLRVEDREVEGLREGIRGLSAKHFVVPVRITDQRGTLIPPTGTILLRDPSSGRSTRLRSWRDGPILKEALNRSDERLAALLSSLGLSCRDIDVGKSLVEGVQGVLFRPQGRSQRSGTAGRGSRAHA